MIVYDGNFSFAGYKNRWSTEYSGIYLLQCIGHDRDLSALSDSFYLTVRDDKTADCQMERGRLFHGPSMYPASDTDRFLPARRHFLPDN